MAAKQQRTFRPVSPATVRRIDSGEIKPIGAGVYAGRSDIVPMVGEGDRSPDGQLTDEAAQRIADAFTALANRRRAILRGEEP
ncbi:hypothetical protein [Stackebrandtia soli]|uniref:hypothetical protein n=1 Tax=Stackebrandtia soli TaxID=1892856 RepID=UPI0039E9224F